MVELVDSVDLGSTARACRFESCCPHQKPPDPIGVGRFLRRQDSNPFPCKCPVDTCCHQFKNWWLHLFSFPAKGKENANRVLLPAFCGAENASGSCCPLSAKQKMQVRPLTRLLSQHHIQQHHNRKAEDNAHGGKIGLGSLVSLAFRDQLMHRHQDHCPGGKG